MDIISYGKHLPCDLPGAGAGFRQQPNHFGLSIPDGSKITVERSKRTDRFAKSAARKDREGACKGAAKAASSKRASILGYPAAGQGPDSPRTASVRLMLETTESPLSFEAALAELEELVGRMESGELPLQESLAAYKRGAELLVYCQSALKDAQQQVQVLEKGLLQPFAADDPDDA